MNTMNIDELKSQRDSLETQFNNLSDPQWVHTQREQLRGKFDILNQVIASLEQEQQDAASNSPSKRTDSANSKRK